MLTEPNYIQKFQAVIALTTEYCAPLKVEDHIPQPVEFVSPPKWHLGHTTWFFEEFILKKYSAGYQEFHPDFSYMFNSYYNTVGKRVLRANRGNMSRPTLEEVHQYRSHVDDATLRLLQSSLKSDELKALIDIGINHEQQHQELLLTDLKYILGHNPLFPPYRDGFTLTSDTNDDHGWIRVDAGVYNIGADHSGFSYDNEHSSHQVYLDAFEISNSLVTNAEYLEFINDDGYKRHELWLDEGWAWVTNQNISAPMYWHKIEGQWYNYTLSGLRELIPEAILSHISHYEAAAFAEWKRERLPTEFEWEAASDQINWGKRWEHTASAYLPYPGFKKPDGAVGEYNGKFMMNQMVLRGASCATSPDHSRNTYRNFFHPNMQWQFSGIRLVKK